VVLHAECWSIECAKALDTVIVQTDMTDLNPSETGGRINHTVSRGIHRETMVVSRDFDPTGLLVKNGLVDAAVPVFELVGIKPESATEQLIAETDSKEWDALLKDSPQKLHVPLGCARVAGAI
jgi:hypothetical protein